MNQQRPQARSRSAPIQATVDTGAALPPPQSPSGHVPANPPGTVSITPSGGPARNARIARQHMRVRDIEHTVPQLWPATSISREPTVAGRAFGAVRPSGHGVGIVAG